MCGIIGYVGNGEAAEFLMQGLTCLEYRGYDSAGIAVFDGRDLRIEKAVGRLDCLKEKLQGSWSALRDLTAPPSLGKPRARGLRLHGMAPQHPTIPLLPSREATALL